MGLTALVMAGGKSSRTGLPREKPLVTVGGKSMIEHVIDALRGSSRVGRIIVAYYVLDTKYAVKRLGLTDVLVVSADLPLVTTSPVFIKTLRDVLIFEFDRGRLIVVGCDSAGGVGPKPLDKVKVDGYTLGRFTARVALTEVLCTGAKPICLVNTLSVEPKPTGDQIVKGIKDEARRAGLDPSLIEKERGKHGSRR